MVSDAKRFKADDDTQKDRDKAMNSLESCCYKKRLTIKLKSNISESDRKTLDDAIGETLDWLEGNHAVGREGGDRGAADRIGEDLLPYLRGPERG